MLRSDIDVWYLRTGTVWACKGEIIGGLIKLHNEKPYNLYSLSNIIEMVKSRKMRLVGYVVCMGENRDTYRFY
jgi:hypothetical protein